MFDFKKAKRLWVEDECLLWDPTAERVDAAWQRLFGQERPDSIGEEHDIGDAFAKPYPDGLWIVFDYMKTHSIWQMPHPLTAEDDDPDGHAADDAANMRLGL